MTATGESELKRKRPEKEKRKKARNIEGEPINQRWKLGKGMLEV